MIDGCGTCRNPNSCGTALHGLGPGGFLRLWITVQNAYVVSVKAGGQQIFAPYCSVSGRNNVHPKASLVFLFVTTPALLDCVSRSP